MQSKPSSRFSGETARGFVRGVEILMQ